MNESNPSIKYELTKRKDGTMHSNSIGNRILADKRREEIRELFTSLGGIGLPVKALAERHGVSIRKIYDDIERIRASYPKPNVENIIQSWRIQLENASKTLHEIMITGNKSERINAARALGENIKKYEDLMTKMGYLAPDPAPTQVNIATTGDVSMLPGKIVFIEKQQNIVLNHPKQDEDNE